ncbi:ferrous iron transport protein A [Candidatus Bipolaricaulota bacterium]|nr:ferrous iron transport protein A [Candidatus Bipolaricaulota bacterium]MCK4598936.1 ferrous iron transport protein A [Candidatus Bipolaricaulota bacterium]
MATKPLKELKPNEKGKVVKVGGRGSVHRRLLDMGLVAGTEVEVERVAPLGDPIEVKVKGYHLTLRKEEAANIQVEVA